MSDKNQVNQELIDGFIVALFSDNGPTVIFNDSPLNESVAFNLVISMWIVLGGSAIADRQLWGPLPIPDEDLGEYNTLAFVFSIAAMRTNEDGKLILTTRDDRLAVSGRPISFWLIFHSKKKREIMNAQGILQEFLEKNLSNFKNEDDLTVENMQRIKQKLDRIKHIDASELLSKFKKIIGST